MLPNVRSDSSRKFQRVWINQWHMVHSQTFLILNCQSWVGPEHSNRNSRISRMNKSISRMESFRDREVGTQFVIQLPMWSWPFYWSLLCARHQRWVSIELSIPVSLKCRIITYFTHSYLLKGEDMPWCIPCHCPDTVQHILLDCIDLRDTRIKYYRNVNTMQKLFCENVFNIINYLKECGLFKKF